MLVRGLRSPSLLLVLFAIGLITIVLYYRSGEFIDTGTSLRDPYVLNSDGGATPALTTNATLGFGAVYAVSGPGSPRRSRLEQAAAVTGLDLKIPDQPAWTDEDVDHFRWHNKSESQVLVGTVKAWLSHHVILRAFLETDLETALILEDDVDWDIRLRTVQVPLAQQAARSLGALRGNKMDYDTAAYPWGRPKDWDLLYIGHCGDYLNDVLNGVGVGHHHPSDFAKLEHVLYHDPSMPHRTDLHPFTASFLTSLIIPEQTRLLHHSVWPLCTFGYAITRRTAERLLSEIAPAHEEPSRHITAYDAAILTACRDGQIYCYTLTPELFHHMEGESLIADEEAKAHERLIARPPVDAAGLEQVQYRHETSNIGCGFASGEFYYQGDAKKLAFLRETVVGQGKCLKEGRQKRK